MFLSIGESNEDKLRKENRVNSRPVERYTPAPSSQYVSSHQRRHHDAYPAASPDKSSASPEDQPPPTLQSHSSVHIPCSAVSVTKTNGPRASHESWEARRSQQDPMEI